MNELTKSIMVIHYTFFGLITVLLLYTRRVFTVYFSGCDSDRFLLAVKNVLTAPIL